MHILLSAALLQHRQRFWGGRAVSHTSELGLLKQSHVLKQEEGRAARQLAAARLQALFVAVACSLRDCAFATLQERPREPF